MADGTRFKEIDKRLDGQDKKMALSAENWMKVMSDWRAWKRGWWS